MQLHFDSPKRDDSSFRHCIQRDLAVLRQQAEKICVMDSEFAPTPDSVCNDALFLLEILFHSGNPMPNLSWTEYGSLRFKWYLEEGTTTMELHGDGVVNYKTSTDDECQAEGVCALTNAAFLQDFLPTLNHLFPASVGAIS